MSQSQSQSPGQLRSVLEKTCALLQAHRRMGWLVVLPLCFSLFCCLSVISSIFLALRVFPEVGMVVNSQCSNPTPSWNGKILKFQVWKNSFETDPKFNTYKDTTADRRLQALQFHNFDLNKRLLKGNSTNKKRRKKRNTANGTSHDNGEKALSITGKIGSAFKEFQTHTINDYNAYPLILWGSHHKTGTYLAQKIFAVMCAQMKWCCVYHVTRDSVHSIRKSLQSEPVHLLGHTQWIWLPEELGVPYKFIHLHRHPYKKIISGYRYHMEGAEAWCTQPLFYNRSCELLHRMQKISDHATQESKSVESFLSTSKSKRARRRRKEEHAEKTGGLVEVERSTVQSYCKSIHLCEPCCRREHELPNVAASHLSTFLSPATHLEELQTSGLSHFEGDRKYALRNQLEYDFMCNNLQRINVSLMNTLNSIPIETGLRVEAAIDYYESLRMARIINHTRSDPASLNIDLDVFMGNYEGTVESIMKFLQLPVSEEIAASLTQSMQFYDITSSYYYRLVMTNPLTNHVDTKRAEVQKDLMAMIKQDQTIVNLYAPILEMMGV